MQEYDDYTKEELMTEIRSLKRLNSELLQIFHETERLEFGWSGNLGQWFWDFTINEVTFNPLKATTLGYTVEELPEKVPFQFFTEKLHPDDYEDVMQKMRDHLADTIPVWEVKYRIQAKDGSWKVYQDRGKVTDRNENGDPLFLKGIVFDVTEEEQEREQLKVTNQSLKSKAKKDPLTSLYTRSALLLELAKQAGKSKNQNQPLSLIVLHIDKFSQYEEEFGVILSEEVLKATGKAIQNVTEDKYVAGRYREAVFMILVENGQKEEAYTLAEKVREMVLDTFFAVPRSISISAGVSTFNPEETISELIQQTTEKVVEAQRNGGDQTIV